MTYLEHAANDSNVILQAANRYHLPLPTSLLGECGFLVRASTDDGPIEITTPVSDFVAGRRDPVVQWDLWSVEHAKSDITAGTNSYRFEPPGLPKLAPEKEQEWWRNALPCFCELVQSVQEVQFVKAHNQTYESWQRLPLIIWAKPIPAHRLVTAAQGDSLQAGEASATRRQGGRRRHVATRGAVGGRKKHDWATAQGAQADGLQWQRSSGNYWESGGHRL